MKSYTVTQRVYSYDAFEEDDIPAGMTAEQYAEARYVDGCGDLDSHEIMLVIEEDGKPAVIIDPVPTEDLDYDEDKSPIDMTGRCGLVGVWTDDDGDEVRAKCIVFHAEPFGNIHASEDHWWTDAQVLKGGE